MSNDNKLPNVVATAPGKIYLVIGEETAPETAPETDFPRLVSAAREDITWCEDKIDANSIPYLRADLAALPTEKPQPPAGWTFEQKPDGAIIVTSPEGGGVVADTAEGFSIASQILHALASDLLDAEKPAAAAERGAQPTDREWKLREAMARMDKLGPLPGMISAFEMRFGQSWTDREWRQEASIWASAWSAAKSHSVAPLTPDSYTTPPAQAAQADEDVWSEYIAGLVVTYLTSPTVDDSKIKPVAGIIRRRLHHLAALTQRPAAPLTPDAWVPIHPRNGPLWGNVTNDPNPERLPAHYPLRPLVFADSPAAPLATDAGVTLGFARVAAFLAKYTRLPELHPENIMTLMDGDGSSLALRVDDLAHILAAHPAAVEVPAQRDEQGEAK